MVRRNDNPVREHITGKLAPYGKRTRPLCAWDSSEDLVLRQDVATRPFEPNVRTKALLREARGLQIDPRHADEDVAGTQPHHDAAIQQCMEDALAHPRHKTR